LKLSIFFTARCFFGSEDFKGTVAQDFQLLFFCESTTYENNFGCESGIPIHEKI
jgi:hypothetical protein